MIFFYRKFEDSQEEMGWPLRIVQSNPTGQQKEKFNVCITSILRLCSLIPNVNKQKDLKKPILLVDFMEPIFPIVVSNIYIYFIYIYIIQLLSIMPLILF